MHVLFVHRNYPAQFRYLAPRLARDFGWRCTYATHNAKAPDVPGVERVVCRVRARPTATQHPRVRECGRPRRLRSLTTACGTGARWSRNAANTPQWPQGQGQRILTYSSGPMDFRTC